MLNQLDKLISIMDKNNKTFCSVFIDMYKCEVDAYPNMQGLNDSEFQESADESPDQYAWVELEVDVIKQFISIGYELTTLTVAKRLDVDDIRKGFNTIIGIGL